MKKLSLKTVGELVGQTKYPDIIIVHKNDKVEQSVIYEIFAEKEIPKVYTTSV